MKNTVKMMIEAIVFVLGVSALDWLWFQIMWKTFHIWTSATLDNIMVMIFAFTVIAAFNGIYDRISKEIERRRVRANFISVEDIYD